MHILLDANLPRSAVQAVAAAGHTGIDVRAVGFRTASDTAIAAYARIHGLCIATRDYDFADVRNYPPADYQGIIVLNLPDDAIASEVCELLRAFLLRLDVDKEMPGRLAIVRADRVRFRPGLAP